MSVVNPVAVKVRGKAPGARNELCWVFEKGVSLPARGTKLFRAARELTSGEKSHYLNLEFYQGQDEGLSETEPLFIGSVEITGKHLGDGLKIRAGDKITLRWEMGVGSILRTMVEFPHLGRRPGNFYIPQRAHSRLDLARETKIVRVMLEAARREAGVLRSAFGDGANAECEKICREIESRRGILDNAGEAGATHRVATETRRILARISGLKHAPENRGKVLRQKIHDESRDWFSRYIRPEAAPKTVRLFDAHKDDGLACIDEGDLQAAEFHIREAEKSATWRCARILVSCAISLIWT